jgi:phospholipid/cholesterol/gamma-HCH transport system substrate-binding protein
METKANYPLIGGFVIFLFSGLMIFVLWISNVNFASDTREYHIFFAGSVAGLKNGSTVMYRGVPIGTVQSIDVDKKNIDQVKVRIGINDKVPLRKTMVASLETQGLTGIAYVQISGGTQSDPLLEREIGQKLPVVPSQRSLYENVTASVPELLKKLVALADDMRGWFDDNNRKAFAETLHNIQAITEIFDPANKEGNELMHSLHDAADNLNMTLKELGDVSHEIRDILGENRKGLKEFSNYGLTAFSRFLQEGQETLVTFRRFMESIERSPSRFLHNDPSQGVRLK